MDSTSKPCTTIFQDAMILCSTVDRLSSLPDELLIQILSLLPTKDAYAMSIMSKRWKRVLPWITSFNFDDLGIYHYLDCPHLIENFATFMTFMDRNVLQACQSKELTRFNLRFYDIDDEKNSPWFHRHRGCYQCGKTCFDDLINPTDDLISTRIDAWISFPLSRGVKELELFFHVKEADGIKLPQAIFTCEPLEVLKLYVNVDLEVPMSLCLPNLKLLHLFSVNISDGYSLSRLVSSCPSLEVLAVKGCLWEHGDVLDISAPSLRRFAIECSYDTDTERNDVVLITPKLEYLDYQANIPLSFSVSNLNALVEARIMIFRIFHDETDCEDMLTLLRPLFNVKHLSLFHDAVEALEQGELMNKKLPMFHNLSSLELGYNACNGWHDVLLELLNCMPSLERLAFPDGVSTSPEDEDYHMHEDYHMQTAELEYKYWSTTQVVPPCFVSHLKRIMICCEYWLEWVLEMVKYFLRTALVLEELVLRRSRHDCAEEDRIEFENMLNKLPRGSITCSIKCIYE